jgi:hypothetical protein
MRWLFTLLILSGLVSGCQEKEEPSDELHNMAMDLEEEPHLILEKSGEGLR